VVQFDLTLPFFEVDLVAGKTLDTVDFDHLCAYDALHQRCYTVSLVRLHTRVKRSLLV